MGLHASRGVRPPAGIPAGQRVVGLSAGRPATSLRRAYLLFLHRSADKRLTQQLAKQLGLSFPAQATKTGVQSTIVVRSAE